MARLKIVRHFAIYGTASGNAHSVSISMFYARRLYTYRAGVECSVISTVNADAMLRLLACIGGYYFAPRWIACYGYSVKPGMGRQRNALSPTLILLVVPDKRCAIVAAGIKMSSAPARIFYRHT